MVIIIKIIHNKPREDVPTFEDAEGIHCIIYNKRVTHISAEYVLYVYLFQMQKNTTLIHRFCPLSETAMIMRHEYLPQTFKNKVIP